MPKPKNVEDVALVAFCVGAVVSWLGFLIGQVIYRLILGGPR